MFKQEPLFHIRVANGQNTVTEQLTSGWVMRVSPHIRNGNKIKLIDDKRNVVTMSRSLNCAFQPKIQKGKAPEKVVHPYSRKAAYLAREETRLKRKERCVYLLRFKTIFETFIFLLGVYILPTRLGIIIMNTRALLTLKIHLNALSRISRCPDTSCFQ